MEDHRPVPDALLAAVQQGESRQQRGKLKIFLGMAAGVGKTYAMLDSARQQQGSGRDVVVGYAETHGRAETDKLLETLEVVPRRPLDYRGATLHEMDTDAVLARNPDLVLVDELAHTNAPGSRHHKRYQDVIELLEAGINVWTTINVQHFESRSDAVQQITGIRIHETVPDSVLDFADEIELIDLSPEDLRKRLVEGKVYTPERVETAARNFFRVGNLTALREMALRLTAEHVDHQMLDYMQLERIEGPWKSVERLMVAVGPSPFSEQLIRRTRRMAYNLEAPWLAAYIETSSALTPKAQERLTRNIELARSLGAEIITMKDDDVAATLLRIAHQRNVTQVVIGKSQRTRLQSILRGGSLVDRVVRLSGAIDVYVVTGDDSSATRADIVPRIRVQRNSRLSSYLIALGVVTAVTIANLVVIQAAPWFGYQAVGLTELLAVLLIAAYIGRGPALLAALVSAISWNFLFIEPRLTFEIAQIQDVILVVLYFAIAIFTGNLTARLRTQQRLARHNADRTLALYTLAHETATAVSLDDVLTTAVNQIGRMFDARVAIFLPHEGTLARKTHPCSTLEVDDKEFSVAAWVFERGLPAGRFTDTLSQAQAQYRPLRTMHRTVGVIGIRTANDTQPSFDQELLYEMFVNQVSSAIERELLDEANEQAAMLRESERLYTTLLNSISHELRTPIATIKGAATSLLELPANSGGPDRVSLTTDIESAADRLNRLVENLLDMSRLESGRLQLKLEWCDVVELLGVAAKRVDYCASQHALTMHIEPALPLVRCDFVLMEQVVVNLLDNACTYAPAGTPIAVSARAVDGAVQIAIADHGPGIPPDQLERVFEKFYRLKGTPTGGTGLGLSISRGIVEAHGGRITAENVPEGGARFVIRLPAGAVPPPVKESERE